MAAVCSEGDGEFFWMTRRSSVGLPVWEERFLAAIKSGAAVEDKRVSDDGVSMR